MTARRLKSIAIAALALAIALVALALWSGLKAGAVTGPEALVVTARDEVWFGLGDGLWRADADGRLLQETALADAGLPGRPSNLLRHPDGHVVATVSGDPRVFFLDPVTARVARTLTPHWPDDLKRKGQEAINLAFAPDGRFAVATGGGHAVALFDADGGFLARTAPDTYRFTNGLWWSGDDVWTTDTNRFALRRLDGRTLAVRQSVELPEDDAARYLGPARATSTDGGGEPTVALIRFRNGMIKGRVVVVQPGHAERPLPHDGPLEPNDVAWLGDQVLTTDGASLSIVRWNADGRALSPFGDASLARRLQQVTATRAGLQRQHDLGVRGGIAVFAAALLLALAAQRRERQEALAALPPGAPLDLSRLGTPRLGRRALAGQLWRVTWPTLLPGALLVWMRFGPLRQWVAATAPHSMTARAAILGAIAILAVVLAVSMVRAVRRKSRMAEFEPVFNAVAMSRLRAVTTAQLPLSDGEHVVETFMLKRHDTAGPRVLQTAREAMRWVVCTNLGLRVFQATRAAQWLDLEFGLGDVAAVATRPLASRKVPFTARLAQWAERDSWLEITLVDGRTLAGAVTSVTVRDRLVARLAARPPGLPAQPRPAVAASSAHGAGPHALHAALASLLVPGLGQWWQRRPGIGLLLFVAWAGVVLALTIPVAWAVLGKHTDVSDATITFTLLAQAGYALVAGWDAWQAGRKRA
jgi:hypothetical protein